MSSLVLLFVDQGRAHRESFSAGMIVFSPSGERPLLLWDPCACLLSLAAPSGIPDFRVSRFVFVVVSDSNGSSSPKFMCIFLCRHWLLSFPLLPRGSPDEFRLLPTAVDAGPPLHKPFFFSDTVPLPLQGGSL